MLEVGVVVVVVGGGGEHGRGDGDAARGDVVLGHALGHVELDILALLVHFTGTGGRLTGNAEGGEERGVKWEEWGASRCGVSGKRVLGAGTVKQWEVIRMKRRCVKT